MKNIEKYKDTKDALDAFRAWYKDHRDSVLTMSGWLEKEYEAPHPPTLLEAVEAVSDEWYATGPDVNDHTFGLKIIALEKAADREKSKPVRNFDRFATAEEAVKAYECFRAMCDKVSCNECRFHSRGVPCVVAWLYEEAEKGMSK